MVGLKQSDTAQDQRTHDAFAQFGLLHQKIAQPARRHHQGIDVAVVVEGLADTLAGILAFDKCVVFGAPGAAQMPGVIAAVARRVVECRGWLLLAVLGVVQLGFSYRFYAQAIRHVTALEAVLIPVIEPILNPVWVLLFVGERPGPLALVGGVIVLGAVTLRAIASIRQPHPAAG